MSKKPKTYRVMYTVTRAEYYDINTRSEQDAEERAFEEGLLVKEGDATNLECWGITRIPSSVAKVKAGDQIPTPAHTPGRWCSDGRFITAPDPAGVHPDIYIAEIVEIDDEGRMAEPAQQCANGELIAAAPEMLEALQLCEEVLSDLARLDDGTSSVSALHVAKDAIARATGGLP